jgi:hypothetical protein
MKMSLEYAAPTPTPFPVPSPMIVDIGTKLTLTTSMITANDYGIGMSDPTKRYYDVDRTFGRPKTNLLDGDWNTVFIINGFADLTVDLGTPTNLGAVGIGGGNPTTQSLVFKIFLSLDGTTWTQAAQDFAAAYTEATTSANLNFASSGYVSRTFPNPGFDDPIGVAVLSPGGTFDQTCFLTGRFGTVADAKLGIVAFAQTQNARYIRWTLYGNDGAEATSGLSNTSELAVFGPNSIAG